VGNPSTRSRSYLGPDGTWPIMRARPCPTH